jgi:hypothetical protein
MFAQLGADGQKSFAYFVSAETGLIQLLKHDSWCDMNTLMTEHNQQAQGQTSKL